MIGLELAGAFLAGVAVTLAGLGAGVRWASRHPNELLAWAARRAAAKR